MNGGRHKAVSQREHGKKRREPRGVAESHTRTSPLVSVGHAVGSTATARRFLARELVAKKREGDTAKVRTAADAADDDIGIVAGFLHLILRLEPNHGLVQQHVVENTPKRVFGIVTRDGVLNSLADGDPQTARGFWIGY